MDAMRVRGQYRLATLDVEDVALEVAEAALGRARRDATRFGLVLNLTDAQSGSKEWTMVARRSAVYQNALACARWAKKGEGKAIGDALKQLRADIDGVAPADERGMRPPDVKTMSGLLVVAVSARLALVEGRTIDADELAVLASVDGRTVRLAVQTGALQPVTQRRPIRFAPEVASAYLFARGVHGFAPAPSPP